MSISASFSQSCYYEPELIFLAHQQATKTEENLMFSNTILTSKQEEEKPFSEIKAKCCLLYPLNLMPPCRENLGSLQKTQIVAASAGFSQEVNEQPFISEQETSFDSHKPSTQPKVDFSEYLNHVPQANLNAAKNERVNPPVVENQPIPQAANPPVPPGSRPVSNENLQAIQNNCMRELSTLQKIQKWINMAWQVCTKHILPLVDVVSNFRKNLKFLEAKFIDIKPKFDIKSLFDFSRHEHHYHYCNCSNGRPPASRTGEQVHQQSAQSTPAV